MGTRVKIIVEEIVTDLDGRSETRTCILNTPNIYNIEKITEMFRAILYWLTYPPDVIDSAIPNQEE